MSPTRREGEVVVCRAGGVGLENTEEVGPRDSQSYERDRMGRWEAEPALTHVSQKQAGMEHLLCAQHLLCACAM